MQALIDYMARLTVTQGEGLGESFPLFPWEKQFIRGVFSAPDHAGRYAGGASPQPARPHGASVG